MNYCSANEFALLLPVQEMSGDEFD